MENGIEMAEQSFHMAPQIVLGTVLILVSMGLAVVVLAVLERVMHWAQDWFARPPHMLRLFVLLQIAVLCVMVIVTFAVWIWAITFHLLDIFDTLEGAVYFSLVAFTTLGFGDVLLPEEWRLLSGMAAMNGLLMIGLLGAILVEVLRRMRMIQYGRRDPMSPPPEE